MSGYLTSPDAVKLYDLLVLYLRRPDTFSVDDITGLPVAMFVPPLTPTEQTAYDDLVKMAHFGFASLITLAEYQAIKPDIAGLITYEGIANPTLAQTVLAVKAHSHILKAILRS